MPSGMVPLHLDKLIKCMSGKKLCAADLFNLPKADKQVARGMKEQGQYQFGLGSVLFNSVYILLHTQSRPVRLFLSWSRLCLLSYM